MCVCGRARARARVRACVLCCFNTISTNHVMIVVFFSTLSGPVRACDCAFSDVAWAGKGVARWADGAGGTCPRRGAAGACWVFREQKDYIVFLQNGTLWMRNHTQLARSRVQGGMQRGSQGKSKLASDPNSLLHGVGRQPRNFKVLRNRF